MATAKTTEDLRREAAQLEAANVEQARALRHALAALDARHPDDARSVVAVAMGSGNIPARAMRALRAIGRDEPVNDVEAATARAALAAELERLQPLAVNTSFGAEGDTSPVPRGGPVADAVGAASRAAPTDAPAGADAAAARILAGITITTGDEAGARAAGDACEAEHGVRPVDAGELSARLSAAPDEAARLAVALAPDVLRAAAVLQLRDDAHGVAELRRTVRSHKVPAKSWDDGVKHALRALRAEGERAEGERRAAEAAARLEARRIAEAREAEAREARRAHLAAELAPFSAQYTTPNGTTFDCEPGSMVATVPVVKADGTQGRPKVIQLTNASPRIVDVIEERETPEGDARVYFRVAFALAHGAPLAVDVPAEQLSAVGAWIIPATRGRVSLEAGRDVADLTRRGILATAEGAAHRTRRAYLGWVHEGGRWVRVHAGGGIDASGAVEGIDVRLPDPRFQRYALPAPPTGPARLDALDALRELVTLEPAGAVLPLVAFVVRAMVGPGAGMLHVHGSANTGKSLLVALAMALTGEFSTPGTLPGSWESDTAGFLTRALAVAGDLPWCTDDWRPACDPGGAKILGVARVLFNGAGRGALSRARTFNATPEPRGSAVSTGEAVPSGGSWSGLSRVLLVDLAERVRHPAGPDAYVAAPDAEDPERAFATRAPAQLHAAGALLVQWLAARLDTWRDPSTPHARRLRPGVERDALRRWGVHATDRAVDVLAPVALGAEVLCSFLLDTGAMTRADLDALRARMSAALAALADDRSATLRALAPGKAWCAELAALMRAGKCHAAAVAGGKLVATPPDGWELLGWQRRNGETQPQGPAVVHVDARYPGALCVDPAVALGVVAEAARRSGRAVEITTSTHLARELEAAGLLAAHGTAGGKRRLTVYRHVNGQQVHRLAVRREAFTAGGELSPDDTDDTDDTDDAG